MNSSVKKRFVRPPPLGITRRRFFTISGAAVVSLSSHQPSSVHAASPRGQPILQPASPSEKDFVDRAFEMRRLAIKFGDQEYGAIIVRDDTIIGQSWSRVILDQDPTGHAEISAIRDAARRLKNRDLHGAVIYSSSRPCPMCEAAAYWAGIKKMIHGQKAQEAGRPQLCR